MYMSHAPWLTQRPTRMRVDDFFKRLYDETTTYNCYILDSEYKLEIPASTY